MLSGKNYNNTVDAWQVGICAFMMATGKLPFYSSDENSFAKKVCMMDYDVDAMDNFELLQPFVY